MRAVRPSPRRTRGFTLVELIITLAVAAIVLTAAAPSFSALVEKQRLDGAASQLAADLKLARDEAMRRGTPVFVSRHGTRGCYVLHTGSGSSCTCTDEGAVTCHPGADALKTVGLGNAGGISLVTKRAYVRFEPLHGSSPGTNDTLTLTAASGRSIQTKVDTVGRVHACSPMTTAPAVSGYPVC